jgi:hypothetical protein
LVSVIYIVIHITLATPQYLDTYKIYLSKMIEQLGNLMSSVDILSLGIFIPIQSLWVGIGLLLSNGDKETFFITLLLLNLASGIGLYFMTREGTYFFLAAVFLVIILFLPSGMIQYAQQTIIKQPPKQE